MPPKKKTTAQNLSNIIKSARDIMRKDKGLSGDLDRLPMLTWIMFLKFLDEMEHVREYGNMHYIKHDLEGYEELYDWVNDPQEEEDLAGFGESQSLIAKFRTSMDTILGVG